MGAEMLRRKMRVTVRFTDKEYDTYKELFGPYTTCYNWTTLIHRALSYYHDAHVPKPIEIAAGHHSVVSTKTAKKLAKRGGK